MEELRGSLVCVSICGEMNRYRIDCVVSGIKIFGSKPDAIDDTKTSSIYLPPIFCKYFISANFQVKEYKISIVLAKNWGSYPETGPDRSIFLFSFRQTIGPEIQGGCTLHSANCTLQTLSPLVPMLRKWREGQNPERHFIPLLTNRLFMTFWW